jgi:Xaa-Pro aminopeptidase
MVGSVAELEHDLYNVSSGPAYTLREVLETLHSLEPAFISGDLLPGEGNVGRMGHGLGMRLTEWPSLMPGDGTVLEPGMVITLEPGFAFAPGRMLVHEEDIVIRERGAELLTPRAPRDLPVIG